MTFGLHAPLGVGRGLFQNRRIGDESMRSHYAQSVSRLTIVRPCPPAAVLANLLASLLFAGSPLVTDDPGTPPRQGWEVNVSNIVAECGDELVVDALRLDINYGLADNSLLKIEFPVRIVDWPDGGGHWGLGDLSVGWKYRFCEEAGPGWMASFAPQILVPTGNECLGIGDGQTVLIFPFEIGKHFCDDKLFVYGEVGYAIAFHDPRNNTWKFGAAAEWRATEKLEWLFEVGAFTCPLGADPDEPFSNAGFRYHFDEHTALMASAGRSFVGREKGAHDFTSYVGLQFTWGGHDQPKPAEDEAAGGRK